MWAFSCIIAFYLTNRCLMGQFKYVLHLTRWVGEVIMDFYRPVKPRMFMSICVDRVSKQSNKKLNVIPDLCISPIQGRTGRLIKGVTNKHGPKCKIKYSPSTLQQISPTNWQSWVKWKNELLKHWGQKMWKIWFSFAGGSECSIAIVNRERGLWLLISVTALGSSMRTPHGYRVKKWAD